MELCHALSESAQTAKHFGTWSVLRMAYIAMPGYDEAIALSGERVHERSEHIAELKQNVIFAMEEPETALPPHTQKRIVSTACARSRIDRKTEAVNGVGRRVSSDSRVCNMLFAGETMWEYHLADGISTLPPRRIEVEVQVTGERQIGMAASD